MLSTRAKPHQPRGLGAQGMVFFWKHCMFVSLEQGQTGQDLRADNQSAFSSPNTICPYYKSVQFLQPDTTDTEQLRM